MIARGRRERLLRVAVATVLAWAVARRAAAIVVPGLAGPFAGGNFVVDCAFVHRAPDDPIVAPGVPGGSHDHTFFGNRTTDAFSTAQSLLAGRTACGRRADRSAYWVPTLFAYGAMVLPLGAAIYYRRGTYATPEAIPNGLRIVAGDPGGHVFWNCEPNGAPETSVPDCPADGESSLRLHVDFPECWDGRRLDSADHRAHMAYAVDGVCSATHPVSVPSLRLVVRYPITGRPALAFSSGDLGSAHADVFVAWRVRAMRRLVRRCLDGRRQCGRLDDGPPVDVVPSDAQSVRSLAPRGRRNCGGRFSTKAVRPSSASAVP